MRAAVLVAILSFSYCTECFAQFPGISIPELGIRTDPVDVTLPKVDVIGDIQNPGRIVTNVDREIKNAGSEIDRMRIEASAQASAPALEAWLIQSRNDAIRGGVMPIPVHIRQQLAGFYDEDILNRVRFKVGDGGVANLGNLALNYGDRAAIVLIDIAVFNSAQDAQTNVQLWSHELKHVQQYRDWGVHDFAIRYLRSWNGVENEAIAAENSYQTWLANQPTRVSPFVAQEYVQQQFGASVASICETPWGNCGMAVATPRSSQCYCQTNSGRLPGTAR